MTVKNVTEMITSDDPVGRFASLFTRVKSKYQGFEAPFSERRVLLMAVDALLITLAVWGALWLWQRVNGPAFDYATVNAHWYWFAILLGTWWVLAPLNDLYDIPTSGNKALATTRVFLVSVQIFIFYLLFPSLVPDTLVRPFPVYLFLLLAVPAILLWRWLYAATSNAPIFRRRVLIIGGGKQALIIARALEQVPLLNYQVLGCVDDELAVSPKDNDGLRVLGREQNLPELVRELKVQEVVVAPRGSLNNSLVEVLINFCAEGVGISVMPDLYGKVSRRLPVQHLDSSWMLTALQSMPVFDRLQLGLKRVVDLLLGVLALPILGLLTPLIALAIRMDSPGPIFYRQVRSGRAGKPFPIVKFRTMYSDAEKDGKPRWATEGDPRITSVGRFLRKTRLDELPQILNVLRGEMSIVGPRPERPEFIEDLQQQIPFYRTRLMIKPGLTGWAQINYTYGNSLDDALIKLQYDLYYLHHWSLWLDLYIVVRTIGVIFRFKGT